MLDAAHAALARAGHPTIAGVGITNQRASTIVWERATGRPIGPALGWQDLRTVGECITAKAEHGLALAPNQSATKIGWLLANALDGRDPDDLCFGTVDSWVAWTLSEGALHVTDHSNAAVTGLYSIERRGLASRCLRAARCADGDAAVDRRFVGRDRSRVGAPGRAPDRGARPATSRRRSSGRAARRPGRPRSRSARAACSTSAPAPLPPAEAGRSHNGTFPIVAWSIAGEVTWGVEAIMLSAGTNVEWLRDDMRLIDTAAASHDIAATCPTTDGVVYVPALLGLGTPHWDYGARGTLLGLTRGTTRAHVVRAVLEGVAHRGADMVEAAEADTGLSIPSLRIDGGMSDNPTFVQALADASGKPVEVSPVVEATTLGAGVPRRGGDGGLDRPRRHVDPLAAEGGRRAVRAAQPGRMGGSCVENHVMDS